MRKYMRGIKAYKTLTRLKLEKTRVLRYLNGAKRSYFFEQIGKLYLKQIKNMIQTTENFVRYIMQSNQGFWDI